MIAGMSEDVIYQAIADTTRRQILDRLAASGDLSAGALAQGFAMSQPAVSLHLRVLREAGLVTSRKEGRHRIYSLVPRRLCVVHRWLQRYEACWQERHEAERGGEDEAG